MEKPEGLIRRHLLTALGGLGVAAALPAIATPEFDPKLPFDLKGRFVQGGYCVGQGAPFAELWVDGSPRGRATADGWFYVGFDRDSPSSCRISVKDHDRATSVMLAIAPTVYDIQRVDGLPQQTVTPTEPDVLERIKRDAELKNLAFASRAIEDGFHKPFQFPLSDFRVSGRFGNQRILNGTPGAPHYGFDMAAPTGTPIRAPQSGLVVLAEPDMFYEGGLVFIDHGQGLISMYLHQSEVVVRTGQRVYPGQVIGKVGATGRATGPHLCWRLKWGDRRMDPSLMITT